MRRDSPGAGDSALPGVRRQKQPAGVLLEGCLSGKWGSGGAVKLSTSGDYSMAFLAACAISAVAFVMALIVRRKVQAVIHS